MPFWVISKLTYPFSSIDTVHVKGSSSWSESENLPSKGSVEVSAFSFIGSPNISNTVLCSNVTAKIEHIQKRIVIIETRRFMIGPLDTPIIGHLRETKNQERNELKIESGYVINSDTIIVFTTLQLTKDSDNRLTIPVDRTFTL